MDKERMGRSIHLRLSVDLNERLDREVKLRRAANPGRGVSRADVIREAVHQYLDSQWICRDCEKSIGVGVSFGCGLLCRECAIKRGIH
jgi:hypothetical protein